LTIAPVWPRQGIQEARSASSVVELNAGAVAGQAGERFERATDQSLLPEAGRLSDHEDVLTANAHLDRSDAVAQGVTDLLLDLALDRRIALRLGSVFVRLLFLFLFLLLFQPG
jgi:hypothetical protein